MIFLVNMPFGIYDIPSLGLGIIQALLAREGLKSKSLYFNYDFARAIGFNTYNEISRSNIYIGEWLFSFLFYKCPYGDKPEYQPENQSGKQSLENSGKGHWAPVTYRDYLKLFHMDASESEIERMALAAEKLINNIIPVFMNNCLDKIDRLVNKGPEAKQAWQGPVFAFTCFSSQTLAVLCLARELKKKYKTCRIILGGPGVWGSIGKELISKCNFIDAVSLYEADTSAPDIFREFSGESPCFDVLKNLENLAFRFDNKVYFSGHDKESVLTDPVLLSSRPAPDFKDYFEYIPPDMCSCLPFETSRGCWWGQKHQCRFCGLNGKCSEYRLKDNESIKNVLQTYLNEYPCRSIYAMDNNLSFSFLKNSFYKILSSLKYNCTGDDRFSFFFSIKSNLTRACFEKLVKCGVTSISPGIESLSNNILKAMNKGVNVLQNIYTLKLCREYKIQPRWNMLANVPGEKDDDYYKMLRLIPLVSHLTPPFGLAEVQLYRHSVYFNDYISLKERSSYLSGMKPASFYRALFSEEIFDNNQIAYAFECTWKNTVSDRVIKKVKKMIDRWICRFKTDRPVLKISRPQIKADFSENLNMDMENFVYYEKIKIHDTRLFQNTFHWISFFDLYIINMMNNMISLTEIRKKCLDLNRLNAIEPECLKEVIKKRIHNLLKKGLILFEPGKKGITEILNTENSDFEQIEGLICIDSALQREKGLFLSLI